MSIQVTISANSADEVVQLVQDLASVLPGMNPNSVPPKTEVSTLNPETEKVDPGVKTQPEPESETKQIDSPNVVDIRKVAQQKGKTPEVKKAIKALLDEFGSKSISDVPEEKRAAFLARLEEL